jgi:Mg2+ and Co2+ transporter CorA
MHIVEFASGTLRFLDQVPDAAPPNGFIWIYVERDALEGELAALQRAAQTLGGSPLLDLHVKDIANGAHPSRYDYTSIYDLVIFRRLATEAEAEAKAAARPGAHPVEGPLSSFTRVQTQAVAFVVFDRLLITVHPSGCFAARTFIERFLSDAIQSEGISAAARSRLPTGTSDLMLRMLNLMVDSYLELRKELSTGLDAWQQQLLAPRARASDWRALLSARTALHTLEDLCEGQNDAMQEWLDTQREQPSPAMGQAERDSLIARARDLTEHIQRVVHHVRRMEQSAETAVQLHFSAQSHRTNEIMRVLTALTAVFLPLNLITGFFGMNFEYLPLIHSAEAMWIMLVVMASVALVVLMVFWRKRYISRVGR